VSEVIIFLIVRTILFPLDDTASSTLIKNRTRHRGCGCPCTGFLPLGKILNSS